MQEGDEQMLLLVGTSHFSDVRSAGCSLRDGFSLAWESKWFPK